MISRYRELEGELVCNPKKWLITGVAGFIGSNLLEALLQLNQHVVGLDNFSTGLKRNLEEVQASVSKNQWTNFEFIEGDICNLEVCLSASKNVDYILHNAALGSVPRSIENPISTNNTNISGFLNMLIAARDNNVQNFVYAASSSTYGDHPSLPKVEDVIGRPLSPYAVTKYVNELYADVFGKTYNLKTIGLRYFNVFGPRQNPNGAYAAVIPKWFAGLINGQEVYINGDGETSRDFSYVLNVVQANLLAATVKKSEAVNQIYNVACGERTTLNSLYKLILEQVNIFSGCEVDRNPIYREFRAGDVKHSLADIAKARALLGYSPQFSVKDGLARASQWYQKNLI